MVEKGKQQIVQSDSSQSNKELIQNSTNDILEKKAKIQDANSEKSANNPLQSSWGNKQPLTRASNDMPSFQTKDGLRQAEDTVEERQSQRGISPTPTLSKDSQSRS